jgi:hypothetical protein
LKVNGFFNFFQYLLISKQNNMKNFFLTLVMACLTVIGYAQTTAPSNGNWVIVDSSYNVGPQSQEPVVFHLSEVGTQAQAEELILLPVNVPAVPQVKQAPLLSETTLAAALQDTQVVFCQIFKPEQMHPPFPSPPSVPKGQGIQEDAET